MKHEETIFTEALLKTSPEGRAAFIAEACAGDVDLRLEVEALLEAHEQRGGVLESPPVGVEPTEGASNLPGDPSEGVGAVVGHYKLLRQIGEGGMGVVFMADQLQPVRRRVALKIIKLGMDTRQVIARFAAERQALAMMDHPNIAKIFDAGVTADGRPYFAMEHVPGEPITAYCDRHKLTTDQRLDLFIHTCQAVQHAHQKGVIHRDLKPSNVLVMVQEGKPAPKVIDFGVAKAISQPLTDQTVFTEQGQLIGTPEYMSPEQAEMGALDIDTRSDVYSLGVLLYELLVGVRPFDAAELRRAGLAEVQRIIREVEPARPSTRLSSLKQSPDEGEGEKLHGSNETDSKTVASCRGTDVQTLQRRLKGDLDWIVAKAMEKDRTRRYESPGALAADVRRHLEVQPVLAGPPSATYRLRKFARRNKAVLAAGMVIGLALMLGMGGIGWAIRDRATREASLVAEAAAALRDVDSAYQRDRPAEALNAVQRAEALLGGSKGGDADLLRERARQWRIDLAMVTLLDEIPLERAALKDGHFDLAGSDSRYREAFQRYDLDVASMDPQQAAARVRASAIRDRLVAALDDWICTKSVAGLTGAESLLAVSALADPDPLRNQIRGAMHAGNRRQALVELAQSPGIAEQSLASQRLLALVLSPYHDSERARDSGGADDHPLRVELLRKLQRRHPDDFWINNDLAYFLKQSGGTLGGEAVGFYRVAVALRPQSPGARLNLGVALADQGKWAEAEVEFQELIRLKPDYAEAHSNLGGALAAQDKGQRAEAECREAIRLQPDYANAYHNLGTALAKQGKLDKAAAAYRQALRLGNDNGSLHYDLGSALLEQDKPGAAGAAEQEFRKAIRLKPDMADAYHNLGIALAKQGKFAEAADKFQQAIRLNPNDPQFHYNLGNALLQKEWELAESEFREAIRLKPDYAEAYDGLGLSLKRQNKLTDAVAAYGQAIRLMPEFAEAHLRLGSALFLLRQFPDAEAEFHEAIRLNPNLAEAHFNLANALVAQNKVGKAQDEFREAIRLKPDYADAHLNLANLLFRKGDLATAEGEYRQVTRLKPDYAEAFLVLGATLTDQGKLADAEKEFRQVTRLRPDESHGHYDLSNALYRQGKLIEAEQEARAAIRLDPNDATARELLAKILQQPGVPAARQGSDAATTRPRSH